MGDDAVFAAQQRRVTEQLGAAMLAAVGLMVRQYLGAPTGENEGQDLSLIHISEPTRRS